MQQVTLVLRGDAADITDVIQLALAGGLLHSMTQDAVPPHKVNNAHARRKASERTWTTGQRVKVIGRDLHNYPQCPPIGTEGVVSIVHATGLKSAVTVRFTHDDDGKGPKRTSTVRLGGRMIKALP